MSGQKHARTSRQRSLSLIEREREKRFEKRKEEEEENAPQERPACTLAEVADDQRYYY